MANSLGKHIIGGGVVVWWCGGVAVWCCCVVVLLCCCVVVLFCWLLVVVDARTHRVQNV